MSCELCKALLPPANEVCEGYVFTGVCLSTGGGCVVAPGGHAWLLWGGMCGCSRGACVVALGGHAWLLWGGHAWDTTRYGDTVNKWAVRILLECILVVCYVRFRKDIYI